MSDANTKPESDAKQTSGRILLVDDDQEILNGARLRLRSAGFSTLSANDGQQCVTSAIQHQPDAILMDIRMPNMDGLMAMKCLKQNEQTKHIPIVMLSASVVDQHAALAGGARFFLAKPYQGKDLLAAVQVAMTKTQSNPVKHSPEIKKSGLKP